MNRIGGIVTAAALAMICVASAQAQRTVEPAIPRGLDQQPLDPPRPLSQPPSPPLDPQPRSLPGPDTFVTPGSAPARTPVQLNMNAQRAQRDADARHCLAASTNKDVHRCAERYRSRASRAATVRASAKPKAAVARSDKARAEKPLPVVVDAAKPEVLKPGAPRPEDKAKAADLVKPMDVTRPSAASKAPDATAKPAGDQKSIPSAEAAAKSLNLPRMGPKPDPTAAK